jgi:signal transduction histidine kinase
MTTVALAAVAEAKRELSLLGNIQLETSLPDLPPAAGASGLIYTALKNLIISAARSLPDGGIIQIGGAADEHYVWIEVTDPALPPSTDFQAISAQIQRAHALELIIARQTARVHGGQVRIDANQAGGTCMRFILPRWEAQNGVTHASMETS